MMTGHIRHHYSVCMLETTRTANEPSQQHFVHAHICNALRVAKAAQAWSAGLTQARAHADWVQQRTVLERGVVGLPARTPTPCRPGGRRGGRCPYRRTCSGTSPPGASSGTTATPGRRRASFCPALLPGVDSVPSMRFASGMCGFPCLQCSEGEPTGTSAIWFLHRRCLEVASKQTSCVLCHMMYSYLGCPHLLKSIWPLSEVRKSASISPLGSSQGSGSPNSAYALVLIHGTASHLPRMSTKSRGREGRNPEPPLFTKRQCRCKTAWWYGSVFFPTSMHFTVTSENFFCQRR